MNKNKSLPLFAMLPPFYDAPLYKNVDAYLRRIEQEFNIKIKKYSYLRWAFGNDVFVINNEIVFRFPKTEQLRSHLPYEIDFLKFLKNKVKVHIPSYFYVSKAGDFAGYDLIEGKILTPSAFKKLGRRNKEIIVDQLIEFINILHQIDFKRFALYKPGKREDFIEIEKRIEDEMRKKLFPKLSRNEVDLIKNFYRDSKKYLQGIPSSCPIHGDLYAYNIIWSKDKTGVGVIDFDDYLVGDPAKDFEVFYDYGQEYAELAYQKYSGPKDKDFLQRAKNYYKVHGIYTLLSSLLGARISFDYAYSSFFKPKFYSRK